MQAPQQSPLSIGVAGQHVSPDDFVGPRKPVEGGLQQMSLLRQPRRDPEMERLDQILEVMPPMVVEMLNTGEMTIEDVLELHDRMTRVNQPSLTGQAAAIPGVPFLPTGYMMAPPR